MDHTKVLKRAWEILKQYRVLWIFGLILALTTGTAGSPGSQSGYQFDRNDVSPEFSYKIPEGSSFGEVIEALVREITGGAWQPRAGLIITLIVVLVLVILALGVLATVARYVSETSLIRMVDQYEETGEKFRFRQGWKLGWSREAWRLFLLDLVIFIPVFVGAIVLLGMAALPLLLWVSGSEVAGIIGTVAAIGFFFLVIFVIIVVAILLRSLIHFFRRACVLEGLGVRASLRQGFALVRQNWKDVGLMWLIVIGLSIGWTIVMIPVVVLLVGVGAVLGGVVGLMVRGLVGLAMGNVGAWIVAGLVALPVLILVIAVPASLLNGLKEVYLSSTWTLTYRELRALGQLELLAEPIVSEPGILEPA
ncbi:MAG: DUF7544 domain-containing protein [Anaerolineae bacterium]